jgi:two-component system phosphate regulon sensor histidine kinase PhoR
MNLNMIKRQPTPYLFYRQRGNENINSITFPSRKVFTQELVSITILSIVFTFIIIITYSSALIKRYVKISEIKTDFINNMTQSSSYCYNKLTLDAIKNLRLLKIKKRFFKYFANDSMKISDAYSGWKRFFEISKLRKEELDIEKRIV